MDSSQRTKKELEHRSSPSVMSKRFFTVQAISNLETLTLTSQDMDEMKQKFTSASKIMIRAAIKQTCTVFNLLLIMVSDLNRP